MPDLNPFLSIYSPTSDGMQVKLPYAFDLDGGRLALLGATPGYSRPAIAQGSNAVMLPVFNGASAPVRFEVGMLPS